MVHALDGGWGWVGWVGGGGVENTACLEEKLALVSTKSSCCLPNTWCPVLHPKCRLRRTFPANLSVVYGSLYLWKSGHPEGKKTTKLHFDFVPEFPERIRCAATRYDRVWETKWIFWHPKQDESPMPTDPASARVGWMGGGYSQR